jgi:hypothetical protein
VCDAVRAAPSDCTLVCRLLCTLKFNPCSCASADLIAVGWADSVNDSGQHVPLMKGHKKPSPADFMFGTTLGEGAYARVVHARMKDTGAEYAVKIMEKRFIMKEKKVKFVMMERKVFTKVSSDRIVKLYYTFHVRNSVRISTNGLMRAKVLTTMLLLGRQLPLHGHGALPRRRATGCHHVRYWLPV